MRVFVVISFLFLIGCNKDKVRSTQTEIYVFNASPNAGGLQLLQNLKPIGNGFDYVRNFTPATPFYQKIDSGFNNYKVKKGDTEIANLLISNTSNKVSLFLFDSLKTFRTLLVDDKLDTPGQKFAKVRILHLAPDVDTFNLALNNGLVQSSGGGNLDWIYYSQEVVKRTGLAGFFNIDSGNYVVEFRRKNPSAILKAYNYRFRSNGVYSLILKGYKERSGGDSLSLSIIQH